MVNPEPLRLGHLCQCRIESGDLRERFRRVSAFAQTPQSNEKLEVNFTSSFLFNVEPMVFLGLEPQAL
jgi:hypothetical protein